MQNAETLVTLASVICGFSLTVFIFRINREIQMDEAGEPTWVPWADRLLIAAFFICLLVLIEVVSWPVFGFHGSASRMKSMATAGSLAALILLGGYMPSICAHYRLGFGKDRSGPRDKTEPSERIIVRATCVVAVIVAVYYPWLGY